MDAQLLNTSSNIRLRRGLIVLAVLAVLLLLSIIVSLNTGHMKLAPLDTLRTLVGGGTDKERLVLFQFRLPRIVLSVMVGAGLALSGCLIQGVSRNALADPGLLGINAGAGLVVLLYLMLGGATTLLSIFTLPFLALAGGSATAALIYMLAYKYGEGISTFRLIVTGVALQAGIGSAMTVLVLKLDESEFDFLALWQAGSIWGSNWHYVLALLPWLLAVIPYVMLKARSLDVLNLGDDRAGGLGLSVERERRKLLAAAVALAASCMSVSGSISFVGLIAPHLARRLVGGRHALLLPASLLAGALLVSVADMVGRVFMHPDEIPTGLVVAVIGAPYFLYLLTKTDR
ncbi:Iron-uptake system permease protein FeuC [compost metagenome]